MLSIAFSIRVARYKRIRTQAQTRAKRQMEEMDRALESAVRERMRQCRSPMLRVAPVLVILPKPFTAPQFTLRILVCQFPEIALAQTFL